MMKLAEITINKRTTSLHYNEGWGYSVYYRDPLIAGGSSWIRDRERAEQIFLWDVGYPEWTAAGGKAYREARDAWLAEHQTLESIDVVDFRS